jgi:hypothetical protein
VKNLVRAEVVALSCASCVWVSSNCPWAVVNEDSGRVCAARCWRNRCARSWARRQMALVTPFWLRAVLALVAFAASRATSGLRLLTRRRSDVVARLGSNWCTAWPRSVGAELRWAVSAVE